MLTDNLIALYHLNNAPEDSSGNGNTATPYGDFTYGAAFLGAASGSFGGATGYLSLANEGNFDFEKTDAFSISLWLKTSTNSFTLISKNIADVTLRGWMVFVAATGYVWFGLYNDNGGGNKIEVLNPIDIGDGAWHHVVVTYDGSETAAGCKIYLDNVEASTTGTDALTGTILNNVQINVGRRTNNSQYYTGLLDEVVFYERELIAREVNRLYNGGAGIEVAYVDSRIMASHGSYLYGGRRHPYSLWV
jgi:hypothetical protein